MQGDEKTSHITQRGKGEAFAESQSWTVVGAFEDLDVSAIKLSPWERPDLAQWLTDRADDWDTPIFAKTDRAGLLPPRGRKGCVRRGYGVPPFGFEIVDHPTGAGKALEFDVEAQGVLHAAAVKLLAGGSLVGIVTALNADGS
jgi:hypothetical protein